MSRQYTIAEISQETGLAPDTLRFYEKKGLLRSPERGPGGVRRYSEEDLGRIRFLLYLRNTSMPLKEIQTYVEAYNRNDETACFDLLDKHRVRVEEQARQLSETLEVIKYKLKHFQDIKDGTTKGR
ncbi:MerR family transcriptional regulator [Cohnella rhizosphaerae]|uniref:MerR family transcriptional regulator n=1 Tax=Cohnella rhizosphaerae TaxID=1457232 RepID=A0A9X4L0K6_9BACL|nr:MerR family transcriptional regulator [Cohnella rhizosphaerae]MDG0813998.1 MerR family transcriptional regulator [Cohnella rhizosphaerae]